jgi:Raf kinase inhibitor-like YbhB/YbcL family protein
LAVKKKQMSRMLFKSSEIGHGENIPIRFTCDGVNISPSLKWKNVPSGTKSFVIIVDDPDAIPVVGSIFTHFAVINLQSDLRQLDTAESFENMLFVKVLKNDFGTIGWSGPCPPIGDRPHKYRFTLYALKSLISYNGKLTVEIFERNFHDSILAKAYFIGEYHRNGTKSAFSRSKRIST